MELSQTPTRIGGVIHTQTPRKQGDSRGLFRLYLHSIAFYAIFSDIMTYKSSARRDAVVATPEQVEAYQRRQSGGGGGGGNGNKPPPSWSGLFNALADHLTGAQQHSAKLIVRRALFDLDDDFRIAGTDPVSASAIEASKSADLNRQFHALARGGVRGAMTAFCVLALGPGKGL